MAFVKEMFVAIIVVSALLMGVSSFFGGLTSTYNVTTNETEIESLSKMEDVYDTLGTSKEQLTGEDASTEGIGDIMLKASWNFIMQLFYSVDIVQTLISDAATIMNIPDWALTMTMALMLLLFLLAILYATIKVKF